MQDSLLQQTGIRQVKFKPTLIPSGTSYSSSVITFYFPPGSIKYLPIDLKKGLVLTKSENKYKTDLKPRKVSQMQKRETSNMQHLTSRLQVGFSCVWPLQLKVDCGTEQRAPSVMCQDFVTRKWVELFIFQQSPSRTQGRSVSNLRRYIQASSGSGRIEGRENNQVHVQER